MFIIAQENGTTADAPTVKPAETQDKAMKEKPAAEARPVISTDGFIMTYAPSPVTVLSLSQALNHHKYDHFEVNSAKIRTF